MGNRSVAHSNVIMRKNLQKERFNSFQGECAATVHSTISYSSLWSKGVWGENEGRTCALTALWVPVNSMDSPGAWPLKETTLSTAGWSHSSSFNHFIACFSCKVYSCKPAVQKPLRLRTSCKGCYTADRYLPTLDCCNISTTHPIVFIHTLI